MSAVDDIANYGLDAEEDQVSKQSNEEEVPTYYVEKVIDKKTEDGKLYYKVVWQGYDEKEATWEPEENLYNVSDLIDDYEEKLQRKKKNYLQEDDRKQSGNKKVKTGDREGYFVESERKDRMSTSEARKNLPETGHLRYRDRPKEIVAVRAMTEPGIFLFRVKWEPRRTGEVPLESYVSSEDFMKYNPRFLLAFYHQKIRFRNLEKGDDKKAPEKKDSGKKWDTSLEENLEKEKTDKKDGSEKKKVIFEEEKKGEEKPAEEDFLWSGEPASKTGEKSSEAILVESGNKEQGGDSPLKSPDGEEEVISD